ncbi:hypothetical protein L4C36_07960 [Photobacterium japonica]|uniref:BRO-N domain-containing protein n=1 Tax=Photobacterium japonica TaxID=2910235 RepID=UPI003D0B2B3C
MNLSELVLSYNSEAGQAPVRTQTIDGELYFSLFDVTKAISTENRILAPELPSKRLIGLLKAHATHLLPDEIYIPQSLPKNIDEPHRESYVTKAGLFRVILQDKSPACRKFQKWVLDDVLPAIMETGQYNLPIQNSDSDIVTLTKLFLKGMEDRERAEAEIRTDVSGLKGRVQSLEDKQEFYSVENYSITQSLPHDVMYEVFIWCTNICSSGDSQKIKSSSQFNRAFKSHIIDEAYNIWHSNRIKSKTV